MFCTMLDRIDEIYNELLRPGKTTTGDHDWTQSMWLHNFENPLQFDQRHDKVPWHYENSRSYVAKEVEK